MRIEIRADSVLIEGYVNAVARDSRPMRDRKTGKRFVEQIVPGVFERALRHNEVQLYLNHDRSRVLGSTSTNLELHEDSIGLHARAEVTDPEVIDKAPQKEAPRLVIWVPGAGRQYRSNHRRDGTQVCGGHGAD